MPSRAAAQAAIAADRVVVRDVPSPKPATLVDADSSISLQGPARPFVSRGGEKLDGALDHFAIDVAGLRCVDVGASTGGFSDCLLQRGAASVVAVDVGYGQLAWSLSQDDRVTMVDRTNIRHADPDALGAPFDLITADLSFISLRTVADKLAALGGPDAVYVLLVKPQFEVGRNDVGKGGIVRDPEVARAALGAVVEALERAGIGAIAAVASSIKGSKGNQEYVLHAIRGAEARPSEVLRGVT